jgi:type I restriction enzyme M protein
LVQCANLEKSAKHSDIALLLPTTPSTTFAALTSHTMTTEELKQLESSLWDAANALRSGSSLKSHEYATPILGIVFLRYVEAIYTPFAEQIKEAHAEKIGKRNEEPIEVVAKQFCRFYLPEDARYEYLLSGAYKASGKETRDALQHAMRQIEAANQINGTLPIDEFNKLSNENVADLLKKFSEIPISDQSDIFGKIYEYFLGEFAMSEGQKGGEFYTPGAVVRLMVEVIEPTGGELKLLDPACGSGGMFVQTANYLRKHRPELIERLRVYGYEKTGETARLAKMNAFINGIGAFIQNENTFETTDQFVEQYDYVLANPPFNVKDVKASVVENKEHFTKFGLPKNKGKAKGEDMIPNANYLWINLFASALKSGGKAGLVMANSASDGSGTEMEIRQRLLRDGMIDAMLTLSSNMFNTVTLPATLWFFGRKETPPTPDQVRVLFVDARNVFTQISRKQRTFTDEQVQNIALIFKLSRGERKPFEQQVALYSQKITDFNAQAEVFYPQVLEAKAILDPLIRDVERAKAELDAATDSKAQEKAKKTLQQAERERNRQSKEYERLQAEYTSIIKQRDYFQNNHDWLTERFPDATYRDVTGLCKLATIPEIAEQNYSLNPGRYVGVVIEHDGLTAEEFSTEMHEAQAQLNALNSEAHALEQQIAAHFNHLFTSNTEMV